MTPPNKQPSITDADREAAENLSIIQANIKINSYSSGKSLWEIFKMGHQEGYEAALLHERAKVDELVRALEMIASRTVEPFFEGIDPNSSLGLSMYADSALKQYSGRSG